MKRISTLPLAGVLAVAISGCTSGNTAVPPPQNAVDPITTSKLQFAVGTANIAGTAGLNTVVTLRQPNGGSAVLLNTPTITGPATFVNTGSAAAAGADSGTNKISGSPQPLLGTAASPSTFGTTGGAFGYGFQPNNSNTFGSASFARYLLPFYAASSAQARFIGGPPAFPQVRDGTFPSGFQGYPMGFTDFAVPPVAGTYTLNVVIPTGFDAASNPTSGTITATASLASIALLPAIAAPTFTPDGAGGGAVTVTIPAGVTEAYVIIADVTKTPGTDCFASGRPVFYTLRTTTVGTQTLTLPPNLGPTGPGFANVRSICSGDKYQIYAVGFDYPANGAAYPFSTSQTPPITGANGQADITTSPIGASVTYP